MNLNRKVGFIVSCLSIITVVSFSLAFSLIEVISGFASTKMYDNILLLFIIDVIFLVGSLLFLFLLGNKIFSSNSEETNDRLHDLFRWLAIIGFILMLPYLIVIFLLFYIFQVEYVGRFSNTPIGLISYSLMRIGIIMLIMGLDMLIVDHTVRERKSQ